METKELMQRGGKVQWQSYIQKDCTEDEERQRRKEEEEVEAEDEEVVPHQAGPKEKKCCFWSEAECQSQWLG